MTHLERFAIVLAIMFGGAGLELLVIFRWLRRR